MFFFYFAFLFFSFFSIDSYLRSVVRGESAWLSNNRFFFIQSHSVHPLTVLVYLSVVCVFAC